MAGGALTIEAGDDAFHAETKLVIDGGTVDVTSCYEGYEAEKIYVNGGETHIVASDDAVNAAAADLSGDEADATATTTDARAAESFDPAATGEMPDGAEPPAMDAGAMPQDGAMPGGMGGAMGEREQNGGMPDNAFAEGGAPTMGDENCLIQVNGGYTVLDAAGDAVDSNGSVEVTGGVLLVNGPMSGGDGAFDYDLTATVTGGTVLMVGSTGMAQNFTSGEQPFAFITASGNAGGQVSGANADGYADVGTVSGGTTAEITASTTASGGMGGLGMGGGGMPAGQGGDIQRGMRGAAAQ